jgi:hypothetical protein
MIISLLTRKISRPRRATKRFYAHSLSAAAVGNKVLKYTIPAYTTFDAALGVVKDNWTAQLTGSNLSNSDAATNISAAQWIKATTIPLRPRVLMPTISYRSERHACGHRQQACPHLAPQRPALTPEHRPQMDGQKPMLNDPLKGPRERKALRAWRRSPLGNGARCLRRLVFVLA